MSTLNVNVIAPESGTDVTVDGNLVVTGTNNIRPYKVYTGLISQTGTNDPTVVIMENTIGNIVWQRIATGQYTATLTNAFTVDKTYLVVGPFQYLYNTSCTFLRNNDSILGLTNQTNNIIGDGILDNTPIEIRVYN